MNWYIIIFAVLSIILFVISQYYRLKLESQNDKIEAFQNKIQLQNDYESLSTAEKLRKTHKLAIRFVEPDETADYLKRNSPYIIAMNQPNLIARGCASQDELFNKYLASLDIITETERETVNLVILDMLNKIQSRNLHYYNYLVSWIRKIGIAKAKPWLEGGMPHTLENIMIMDVGWFKSPRINTFIHELTHIHQRQISFEFDDLYNELGYIRTGDEQDIGIRGIEGLLLLNRNNPDGMSPNWIWQSQMKNGVSGRGDLFWIGAVFFNAIPNSLLDVDNIAVRINKGVDGELYYLKQQPLKLANLKEFTAFFGGDNVNNYHPNEMSARYAEIYCNDILGGSNNMGLSGQDKFPGYRIYKQHMEKLIKTYY
jgi:hypothetical protein